jgi:hypothetical protein
MISELELDVSHDSIVDTRWVYANKKTVDWLLSINTRNRKKKEFQIKTIVNRIKTGQWRDVGDSIAISASNGSDSFGTYDQTVSTRRVD